MNQLYNEYTNHMQKTADVQYALALLQWDQEVYMPQNGVDFRSRQIATLAGMAHELSSSASLGTILEKLKEDKDLNPLQSANVHESLRQYRDQKKYTTAFIVELNQTISASFELWQKARAAKKFSDFAPLLDKLIGLKKKECELLGYVDHPYDALLNQFEPGCTVKELDVVFTEVKQKLVPFLGKIVKGSKTDDQFLKQTYNRDIQWQFGMDVLKKMHFDFNSGRQDISTHPFTTNFNAKDVRVTTRINENNFCEMIFSCIHEGGHALYEQGLPAGEYGLPSGEYLSLAIHESQSRMWENNVGHSFEFWKYYFPVVQKLFPKQLGNITLENFYRAINKVEPSFIRTNADEVTYHFHVLIRYELEKEIFEGTIKTVDLPLAWNEKYKKYLGLEVKNDADGILQDVHWSHGSFGYFPTYSLGSFYAAQFFNKAQQEIAGLKEDIESGNFRPLLQWLREKIHRHGRTIKASELCRLVTGHELQFDYFYRYIEKKYSTFK